MDRGIWATWYDLAEDGKQEYLSWLHEVHIPEALSRPGYLWAAHVENIRPVEREQEIARHLTHTDDPSVPQGNGYLMLFGAPGPHTFLDPSPRELEQRMSAEGRQMLGRRIGARGCVFLEAARVDGPDVGKRAPGITPGPVVQLGSFNIKALEDEDELSTWYARSRLPAMARMAGCIGARKLVSVSGWAKHAILYEFVSMEELERNFTRDESPWSLKVVADLNHAPGSPSLGNRIWPRA